jgi:hypothetical protein
MWSKQGEVFPPAVSARGGERIVNFSTKLFRALAKYRSIAIADDLLSLD